jgi:glucosamine--fructose-6-phosphate aminotransferase (isomerizing)
MKANTEPYAKFALCREMLETVDVARRFDPKSASDLLGALRNTRCAFLTGEGSSRIFPAKRARKHSLESGFPIPIQTDGATQALSYDLSGSAVFGVSNSGKTKEVVRLFKQLAPLEDVYRAAVTTFGDSPLAGLAQKTYVLGCGPEDAVAATKSVVEQALFYHALFAAYAEEHMNGADELADQLSEALTTAVDGELVAACAAAPTVYFAGRNDGVAEELTLKTNEITRKKSDFLEGTYAVHGIEEVMDPADVVILIDPFEEEEEKFKQVLVDGVGLTVLAVSSRSTTFPTITIPESRHFPEYLQLAAGWNLLVEIGLALKVDLDKPARARKVGNEVQQGD